MGIEEQQEEREVLESIFPDEITGTTPRFPYNLILSLNMLYRDGRKRVSDINHPGGRR